MWNAAKGISDIEPGERQAGVVGGGRRLQLTPGGRHVRSTPR